MLLFAFYFLSEPWSHYVSAFIFAIASITDWLDGYLARQRGEITNFGRFLDPVADKLLVATSLVILVEAGMVGGILAMVIIGREILISALREWLAEQSEVVHVSQWGKWKTAMQMVAIETLFLHETVLSIPMHELGVVLLWGAAVLTLWSGFKYLQAAWPKLLRE
jgi:CDP-diacylglycerol--glycerol-3-phosphate 3-phosphatidyltransferase